MLTKKLQAAILALPVVLFFIYLGYHDLVFDGAVHAEEKIAAKVEQAAPGAPAQQLPREYYGYKRAQIALQEYHKGVAEQPRGCNCGPEVDKYTGGSPTQWCTLFVSWVAKEAGSKFSNGRDDSGIIANSRDLATYLQTSGTWYSREQVIEKSLKPEIGDLVLFWRGNFEDRLGHVDVVVDVGAESGAASLVGGNIKDRIEYRENFKFAQNYGFLGFGRPEK